MKTKDRRGTLATNMTVKVTHEELTSDQELEQCEECLK